VDGLRLAQLALGDGSVNSGIGYELIEMPASTRSSETPIPITR
jgi:hypothetical protein